MNFPFRHTGLNETLKCYTFEMTQTYVLKHSSIRRTARMSWAFLRHRIGLTVTSWGRTYISSVVRAMKWAHNGRAAFLDTETRSGSRSSGEHHHPTHPNPLVSETNGWVGHCSRRCPSFSPTRQYRDLYHDPESLYGQSHRNQLRTSTTKRYRSACNVFLAASTEVLHPCLRY